MTGEFVYSELTAAADTPENNAEVIVRDLKEKGAERLLREVLNPA